MRETENYDLHLIDEGDEFTPEPLNENFGKIDETMTRLVAGSYIGNGTKNRLIPLPFKPKVVYVGDDLIGGFESGGGLALQGIPSRNQYGTRVEIAESGFQVSYNASYSTANTEKVPYRYFALG